MADGEKVISSSSGFGEIDHEIIEREINNSSSKRQPYVKYSPAERYKIGKYPSEKGPIATVRKFQQRFPNMNESTVPLSVKDMNQISLMLKDKIKSCPLHFL